MTPTDKGWLTNNPEAAKALRHADSRFNERREAAKGLPLALKVAAYRQAKARLEADHALVGCGAYDRVYLD
jgi:hypothetical protein